MNPMNALPVLFLLLLGCQSIQRSEDPIARDREIVRDIAWQFRDSRFSRIEISCQDGSVLLKGTVAMQEDADEAIRRASGVRSVRAVRSELLVRSR